MLLTSISWRCGLRSLTERTCCLQTKGHSWPWTSSWCGKHLGCVPAKHKAKLNSKLVTSKSLGTTERGLNKLKDEYNYGNWFIQGLTAICRLDGSRLLPLFHHTYVSIYQAGSPRHSRTQKHEWFTFLDRSAHSLSILRWALRWSYVSLCSCQISHRLSQSWWLTRKDWTCHKYTHLLSPEYSDGLVIAGSAELPTSWCVVHVQHGGSVALVDVDHLVGRVQLPDVVWIYTAIRWQWFY